MRIFMISCLSLLSYACLSIEQDLDWEDVTSDYESVLNVMGLLSTDSLVTSFVRVHRSLMMDEASDTLVRDTIFNNIVIYYASRYVVRDAQVIVSNGEQEFLFEFTEFEMAEDDRADRGWYIYKGDELDPQPGQTWTLSVTTPNGLGVSGETIIPPVPQLFKEQLPDTFYIDQTMDISWKNLSDNYQIINIGNYLAYLYDDYKDQDMSFICGLWQEEIIGPAEESWTYRREICEDGVDQNRDEDLLLFNLMSMDDNYFDYFIRYAQDPEFSSLFFGEGGSGRNFGIEGGIGVFGAIGIDRHFIPIGR